MSWLRGFSKRLESVDVQAMSAVMVCSSLVQFFAFYTGMKYLISRNFYLAKLNQQTPSDLNELLTERTFALNTDQPKALLHQVISGSLITSCVINRYAAGIPTLLCAWSCLSSAYLAWAPIMKLFALSAEVRDGNSTVSNYISLMAFKEAGPGSIILATSTMATMTLAIGKSMPWRWSLPVTTLYLIAVAIL